MSSMGKLGSTTSRLARFPGGINFGHGQIMDVLVDCFGSFPGWHHNISGILYRYC